VVSTITLTLPLLPASLSIPSYRAPCPWPPSVSLFGAGLVHDRWHADALGWRSQIMHEPGGATPWGARGHGAVVYHGGRPYSWPYGETI